MHGGVVIGEEPEQLDAFVLAFAAERHTQRALVAVIMRPVAEHKVGAALGSFDAPPGEDAGDLDDILLGVAAIHTQRVQLEQLAGVVLVDPLRQAIRRYRTAAAPAW